ncbi:leucine-rich repeat protein [Lachnoclostridium phytofermentans]|uniref:Leucine-rich repeat domain-containing protein n=1 Tax=Lachnoclostridium phytofermentans (strain ATCC 700394 / DSM 18823 / ISDg) TaxID=357809 RepID=A9KLJ8_LACP7|nr:leucine-rich repeat protein [Lachnoclostridium phytofermentans]ABX41327.1 hypothetical protein Cphy_0945 [Lachnoclostridium phytofermentans ISDg]
MNRIKSLLTIRSILFLPIMVFIISMNTQSVKASESKNYEVKGHMLYLYQNSISSQEQEEITNIKEVYQVTISTSEAYFSSMPVWNTIKELYITQEVKEIVTNGYLSSLQAVFPNLEKIYVDENNPSYQSIDGVLYSKDGTKLISYPMKKGANAIVENGTKVINNDAFAFVSLNHIQIPEGLVCIENFAFRASTLTEISLPKSFRQLESQAFYQSELTSITVASTNPYFVSIDGILYRHDKSFIEYWPEKKQVEELNLPQGMVVLDGTKINNINTIKTLSIPKSLMSCSDMSKNQLVSIQVDESNPYLALFDGVLYSNDFSNIFVYPNQNEQTVIKIHDNIETFPMELFDTVNSTQALKLPKNLKVMEGYNYSGLLGGFRNLSVLELEKSNTYYTVKDGILYDKAMTKIIWFPINLDIKSYTIPEAVTLIDNGQLRRQNHLQKLYVHKNCQLVNYQDDSYYDYETIYDIPLGKECFELEAVIIEEGNPYFRSVDGVVFRAYGKLLLYPCAKKDKRYQIPDMVYVADFNAYNPYLEEIIFSESLRALFGVRSDVEGYYSSGEGKAFQLLPNLKRIKLNGNDYFEIKDNILYRLNSWSGDYQIYSFKTDYSSMVKEYLDSNWVMNNNPMKEVQFSVETEESKQKPENLVEGFIFSKGTTIKYQNEKVVTIQDVSLFDTFPYATIFDKVEKVIIAEGVTSLPEYIFFYFPNVKVISLPKSLKDVGNAFYFEDFYSMISTLYAGETFPYYLSNLEEVKVHPQNSYYTDINGILYNRDVTNLICYPSNKIGKTYIMPESLTSIWSSAFGVNHRLQRIEINALLQIDSFYSYGGFGSYGFLPNLTYVNVDENNLYLRAIDGVLYDKSLNTLIEYPKGKVTKIYYMPETVTKIDYRALYGVQIEELTFPRELSVNFVNQYRLEYSKIGHILDNDYTEFHVIDGVIYDQDITHLIYWPTRKKVKNLTFPSTLQVCYGSINNLDYVESITIPRDMKNFGTRMKMENLKTIYLEKGNKYFTLYDGILYNKALTTLYLMPNKSSISTIRVPANYKGSYMRNFQNEMTNVTKIIIEGSGLYFPYECLPDLKEFELAKGNKKACVVDGVLYNASKSTLIWYPQNKKTKTFTVPSSVTNFRQNTFEVHNYLESITLSDKLSLSLESDSSWFSNCKNLVEIKVSSKSPNLTTIDGVLYTKDKKTLLVYPMGKKEKEYTVLESATKVFLTQNRYLKTLNIGSNVTSIECLNKYFGLQGFTALEAIQVSKKNRYYYSNDGVVYHSDGYGDEMIFYPAAKKDGSLIVLSKILNYNNFYLLKNHKYLKNVYTNSYKFRAYGTNLIEQEEGC